MNWDELIDWLLDTDDFALQLKVKKNLLGLRWNSSDIQELFPLVNKTEWIRKTLDKENGDGTWGKGFYRKYDGTVWVLLHLSDLGATPDHPAIQRGINYLLNNFRQNSTLRGNELKRYGDCPDGVHWQYAYSCITTHVTTILARFGYPSHPVTKAGRKSVRHAFVNGSGFNCGVMDDSLLPHCFMNVPLALRTWIAIPEKERTEEDRQFIETLVQLLRKYELYKYVPCASNEWFDKTHNLSRATKRKEKITWQEKGQIEQRKEKSGWLRFSFPLSYNSDLLQILYLFAQAGIKTGPEIEAALDIIESKRTSDGAWKMVGGLNGKMYHDLDQKGKPSRWITYRALYVLKMYGRIWPTHWS